MFAKFILLISLSVLSLSQTTPNPSLKIAFAYSALDTMKQNIIAPFLPYLVDKALDGKNFSYPNNTQDPDLHFSNITVGDFSVDWPNTHILNYVGSNQSAVEISNLTIKLNMGYDTHIDFIHYQGKGWVQVGNINLNITLGEAQDPKTGAYFLQITAADVKITQILIHFSDGIMQKVFNFFCDLIGGPVDKIISDVLTEAILHLVNEQVVSYTENGINFAMKNISQFTASFADTLYVFNSSGETYASQYLNLTVKDLITNQSAPFTYPETMPDYFSDGVDIQIFMSQDTIDKVVWGALNAMSGYLWINQGNLSNMSNLPVELNTSSLNILLPNVTQEFGPNLGMYVNLTLSGYVDNLFIRDGRFVGVLPVDVDFWVDTDSSQYPNQSFTDCVNSQKCQLGTGMVLSLFLSLDLYPLNASYLGVNLLDVLAADVVVTAGDTDADAFQSSLNNLLGALIPQTNAQLANGIKNPLVGQCGISNVVINIETDYIRLGLSVEETNPSPPPCKFINPNGTSFENLWDLIEF